MAIPLHFRYVLFVVQPYKQKKCLCNQSSCYGNLVDTHESQLHTSYCKSTPMCVVVDKEMKHKGGQGNYKSMMHAV